MTPLLLVHITTASTTLLLCTLAWIHPTHMVQTILRVMAALSLGSGVVLALEPGRLTPAFCAKLGVYLLIIMAAEFKLRAHLANLTRVDPL